MNPSTEVLTEPQLPVEGVALAIDEVNEASVLNYFETFNQGEFEVTSALFATDGVLQPPFEKGIVGRAAIAAYLQKEAKGFLAFPQQCVTQNLENGCTEYLVTGKVQTPLFTVNVSWQFVLSPWKEIFFARIKLLASLPELLKFRPENSSAEVS